MPPHPKPAQAVPGRPIDVLVADDNVDVCGVVMRSLAGEGNYRIHAAHSAAEAFSHIDRHHPEVVLTDLRLGDGNGMQVIRRARRHVHDAAAVLITGYPTVRTAVTALKLGAAEYLVKPFRVDILRAVVRRAVERRRLARENMELREQLAVARLMQATNSLQSMEEVFATALAVVTEELHAQGAAIVMKTEEGERFELRDRCGVGANGAQHEFLEGNEALTLQAMGSGRPAVAVDRQLRMFPSESSTCVTDFISYPMIAKGQTIGALNLIREGIGADPRRGTLRTVGLIAAQTAAAVENVRLYQSLHGTYLDTISALANAIETRDPNTRGHTDRVKVLAQQVGKELGWDDDRLFDLWMGCVLHDVGKIGVPDSILNKPGRLTQEELDVMRTHPVIGARIVVGIPFLRPALPCILYHHERFDGDGYPYGLSGDAIPIEGRVLAVVDTFDAIISDRPYRPGRDMQSALNELLDNSGTQFDPKIVAIVARLIDQERVDWLYPPEKSIPRASASATTTGDAPLLAPAEAETTVAVESV